MAGQDYKRTIAPGGAERINGNGETFLFCKFSDRDVTVDIAGKKAVMRAGSYQEFEPLTGANSAVTIYNDDEINPAAVIFNMGTGTYDEKIIRGEVTTALGVRTASGQFKADSWHTEAYDVTVYDKTEKSFVKWQTLAEFPHEMTEYPGDIAMDGRGRFWISEAGTWTINALNGQGAIVQSRNIAQGFEDRQAWNKLVSVHYDGQENALYAANRFGEIQVLNADNLGLIRYIDMRDVLNGDTLSGLVVCRERDEFAIVIDGVSNTLNIWELEKAPYQAKPYRADNRKHRYGSGNLSNTLAYYGGRYLGISAAGGFYYVDPENGVTGRVDGLNPVGYSKGTVDAYTKTLWLAGDPGAITSKFVALEDFSIYTRATAEPAECSAGNLTLPSPITIYSELAIEQAGSRYEASGKLISMIIEAATGRLPKENYLDHVYGVEFTRTGKKITSGGETFAAAKIADDFKAAFPQRIRLTIDNGLEVQ